MLYDLESHAKDGRCGLYRNEDIRQFVGKLIEKQTLIEFEIRYPHIRAIDLKTCLMRQSVQVMLFQACLSLTSHHLTPHHIAANMNRLPHVIATCVVVFMSMTHDVTPKLTQLRSNFTFR